MVSEDCLIQFYNPHKPFFIECDASKQGIGCVMLQPDGSIPADVNDGIRSKKILRLPFGFFTIT